MKQEGKGAVGHLLWEVAIVDVLVARFCVYGLVMVGHGRRNTGTCEYVHEGTEKLSMGVEGYFLPLLITNRRGKSSKLYGGRQDDRTGYSHFMVHCVR